MNTPLRISLLFLLCSACGAPNTSLQKSTTAQKFTPAPQPLTILRNALQSEKSGEQILALQSIGISMNDDAFQLLEVNTFRDAPEVELTKVQVLGAIRTEDTSRLLVNELKSDMMLIRLEALYALAERKYPSCYQHLEAEFGKIDPDFLYIFPELFAIEGSSESKKFLKSLLRHSDPAVRLGAIQALNQYFPDELIDEMRYLRRDPYPAIQEAVLKASLTIGHRDMQELINQLKASCPDGALIVAKAQHDQKLIEKAAIENNVFAIDASLPSDLLYQKMQSQDLQVRVNATIALLEKRDPRAYEGLFLLFLPDGRDLYFEKIASPGKALSAYKASPSASQMFKRQPWLYERDIALRADWLTKAVELPEEQFLKLATLLFKTEQNELIPLLVRLLENVRSERAIALLQKESEHFGSPLIRTACNLSLFRLQTPGPYYERLVEWIARFHTHDLLKPRTILPWNMKEEKERYTLSFEETSNLLIESYEALAESHRAAAITALRKAIQEGNPHNRALLAGLLLKADS